jgi:hypothetical protein
MQERDEELYGLYIEIDQKSKENIRLIIVIAIMTICAGASLYFRIRGKL